MTVIEDLRIAMPTQLQDNNKRIAKNTLALFFRTFFVMLVSIFTSRVILNVLGVEDFGIYNVVGGFVTMFSLLSSTLTASSQRFISFELGKEHPDMRNLFSGTVSIHLVMAGIIFVLFETVGLWFLNTHLNIAADRMFAANFVYQCSVTTFLISLLSIPFRAMIIAYERMYVFAYISIYEVLSKLGLVYLLYLATTDKLILYAICMLGVSLSLCGINVVYCRKKIGARSLRFILSKDLCKKMLSFSGWNFIGSSAGILNNQGINILINLFFGVVCNAARGIAEQVNNALNSFVLNFMTAMYPQITKSYAAGNYSYMNELMIRGGKYSSFLFLLLMVPFLFETENIVAIWLGTVPEYVPLFIRYALFFSLIQTLSQTLYIGMLATGNIKKYQIIVGGLSVIAFPTTYVLYKLGLPVEFGYVSTIVFSLVCFFARLVLLRGMIADFNPYKYFTGVFLRLLCVLVPAFIAIWCVKSCFHIASRFISIIQTVLLSECVLLSLIWILGIDAKEKEAIKNIIISRIHRI